MSDDYDYWIAKLRGEDPDPPNRLHPPCGRWRTQSGQPVAVWPDNDGTVKGVIGIGKARRKLSAREMASMGEMGSFGVAITAEVYDAVAAGAPWPDMDPVLAQQLAQPGPGHNAPPTDPHELLSEQIEAARQGLEAYAEIESDEASSRAQSLRSRLLELSRKADEERETLKRPHLEAGRKVDARWQPLVKLAKDAADYLASKMSSWETLKVRRQRAQEDQRRRQEVEAQQRDITLPPTEPEQPPPDVPGRIRGAYGRAAAVKTVRVVEIVDWTKAAAHWSYEPGVQAAVKKAAQRAVDENQVVPEGLIAIREERKVT